MRCPKGTAARVRSWRRDILLGRVSFQVPFCAQSALAGAGADSRQQAAYSRRRQQTAGSRQQVAGSSSSSSSRQPQPAASSQQQLQNHRRRQRCGRGQRRGRRDAGEWVGNVIAPARAACLSASFARARRCPSGTALVLPFKNMLLFTSPSYHFEVLESKASISARAIVWGQNGNTFNLKFIGGQPPPKRNALWVGLYFGEFWGFGQCVRCTVVSVCSCKSRCESVLKLRPPGGTKND